MGYYSAPHTNVFNMLFIIIIPCTAGVPGRPEITGFTKPAMEGDVITLTCTTSGSKPAANIRWFRNDKEVQGRHVVWVSQSIVSSVSTCTQLETSLLSSHSAAAFLCAHIFVHCSPALFHCLGFSGATVCLAHIQRCCCCWRCWRGSWSNMPSDFPTSRKWLMIDSTELIIDLRFWSSRYEMSKWLHGNRKADLV